MASWMIHLRVADLLMDRTPGLDETAFVMGNIAPDSGVPNEDWTAYFPPKAVTHYKTRREDETFFDIGRFLREHFTAEQIRAYSRREFSFFLGYYVHLLTDVDWTLNIYRLMISEYVEKRGEDKNSFIWKMKRDWYDLDFRYLEEHPDFRAFNIYEQASGFTNDFMDIFSKDAFDNRREYICGFYRGQHGELYRDYPFLNPTQADAFVKKTVESVFDELKESLAVWNEENTLSLKDLQPSQFYISEKKLQNVQKWLNPSDLSNFEAVPVKMLDGIPVMTDGHTRAVAAILAGIESVPLVWDRDDLSWEMYRRCVEECRKRQILSPQDLIHYIIPETDYLEKWDRWCDQMQADVLRQETNLHIRKMTVDDLASLHSLLSDPEVMRFLEPPYTMEKTASFLRTGLSENPPVYAVEANGTFIGYVICHPYEEDSVEIGWVLLPEYWGHGYASELTRKMIDETARAGKIPVIECDPRQEVTKHIAQKFGFVRAGSRDGLNVYKRNITIKKMETEEEIRGKAYVHWHAWHEAYPGMVSQDYLDRFTLEKAEKMAFSWTDGLIVAKDGNRVIGFVGYGDRGKEAPETGEIFSMYVLSEYYGTGVGKQLMNAGLEQLKRYPLVCLWVLKENKRAIRFYEKCGFQADGQEMFSKNVEATEIRMVFQSQNVRRIIP